MTDPSGFVFRPRVEPLPAPWRSVPLARLARALCVRGAEGEGSARAPGPDPDRVVWLDGSGGGPRRFGLLAFDPLPLDPPGSPGSPRSLGELGTWVDRLRPGPGFEPPPFFAGGFLGALSYDLGVLGDPLELPPDPWDAPPILGGLFVDWILRDEERGENLLVLGEEPGDGRPSLARRRRDLLERLDASNGEPVPLRATGELRRHVPARLHRRRVEAVRDFIGRGICYQANLSQRFSCPVQGDPLELYLRLRELHPAPYAGYLRFGARAILCASPELLLEVRREGDGLSARTRPIKGTIARDPADAGRDAARAAELLASEKDLAELAMIVDLERNDLGRIAAPGSVRVSSLGSLESYASVHHLVGDVEARLAPGRRASDALAALFPGGSITGAPKLSSMEVIAELEGEGRGFSFGSLGTLDLAGEALFNLLIRTPLWRAAPGSGEGGSGAGGAGDRGEITWRVGGGITWPSDPEAEERECLWKGEALARALAGERA